MSSPAYETWSREDLIARLRLLDDKLPSSRTHIPPPATSRQKLKIARQQEKQPFDFSSYPKRKIALKFCYAGWEYNGLAFQNDKTPLPTVEGTLFNALAACRLIDPKEGPEGCGWERCGRTDRGVSAAGQVVSLWVRSNIGDGSAPKAGGENKELKAGPSVQATNEDEEPASLEETYVDSDLPFLGPPSPPSSPSTSTQPLPQADASQKPELRYISMINRVLPPTIRILAWSPVSPSFSSRFACKYRHYKYFFRVQRTEKGPDLDVQKMMDAVDRLIGERDFRNLCKVDASKQITSFKRRILHAEIISVHDSPLYDMWVFNLIGTAFLYHQVRHIMAILFLIGTGLEPPSVMSALLNTDSEHPHGPFKEGDERLEVVECKPEYQMADGLPLMLWDCGYNPAEVEWRTDGGFEESRKEGDGNEDDAQAQLQSQVNDGNVPLFHQMSAMYTRSLIHETLDEHFLMAAKEHHPPPPPVFPLSTPLPYPISIPTRNTLNRTNNKSSTTQTLPNSLTSQTILPIPIGGGVVRRTAVRGYVPLLRRNRLDPVEDINERWRKGKGSRRVERATEGAEEDDGGDE